MSQLTLHHLAQSRSHRILWLLEELGVDYGIEHYERNKEGRAGDDLRAIHPLGRSPVVTLADGTVLAESGAIIETLVEAHGIHLRPEPGTEAHRRYRFFMHYAEGSMMPPLLVKLIFMRLRNAPLPFFLKPVARGIADKVDAAYTDPEIAHHLAFLDSELSDRDFVTSDTFSAADIHLGYPMEGANHRNGFEDYPHLRRYLERLRARKAYQRAIEIGGPVIPATE